MSAYYNEIDPFAAAWLRELIKAKLIADGEVDERSIADVRPDDLRGFRQCHFFAGIGGWSYALRLAGWPDEREVWTGSCPCQPFSSTGAQAGGHDSRDLWPVWFQLIAECRPHVVFGEQVEAAIEHGWLDRLCDDLESEDYAIGPCGLPGPCVGAYDIRQRLWFVADAGRERRQQERRSASGDEGAHGRRSHCDHVVGGDGENDAADADCRRLEQRDEEQRPVPVADADGLVCIGDFCDFIEWAGDVADAESGGQRIDGSAPRQAGHVDECEPISELADADGGHSKHAGIQRGREHGLRAEDRCVDGDAGELKQSEANGLDDAASEQMGRAGQPRQDFWSAADWLPCADGKARPVEPGTFPLAHGIPVRVGRLRGYGNAIKPQLAQVFIEAYMSLDDR